MPRINNCKDPLSKMIIFSTLKANIKRWNIQNDNTNKDKTALTSHHGLYRFERIPIELCSRIGTLQRSVDVILSSVECEFALVYLNDTVVLNKMPQQDIDHVHKVLPRLQIAGAKLKLMKCNFFTNTINYLCPKICPRRLKRTFHTTDVNNILQPLTNPTALRSFFGLCQAFRWFVFDFALIASPRNQHLNENLPAYFTLLNSNELYAMETLKNALTLLPILEFPYSCGHMTLDTDACKNRIACVLVQKQPDDTIKPNEHWSHSLSDDGERYDTTQCKLFAIVYAVLHLQPYL